MPLEFSEYRAAKNRYGAMPQMPRGGENATQSIAIGAASGQSAAFNAATDMIVISKIDANCRIAVGANPVASAATRYLAAGGEYAFSVEPGDKLAVIAA